MAKQGASKNKRTTGAQIHPTENQIHRAAVEWIEIVHKSVCMHSPNELMRFLSDGQKHNQIKLGFKTGWPDLYVPEPRGHYHGMCLELKKDKRSKPSEEQLKMLNYLDSIGLYAKISTGLDETIDHIDHYFGMQKPEKNMNEFEKTLLSPLIAYIMREIEQLFGSRISAVESYVSSVSGLVASPLVNGVVGAIENAVNDPEIPQPPLEAS